MIEQDTIRLLRECDAGVRMGISSIDDVLESVEAEGLRQLLSDCKAAHMDLARQIEQQLERFHDAGKAPNPMAQGMSWIKTNVKIALHDSDKTVADLMTDGCNMGVKSLSKYLNRYAAADERSKDIAKKLIAMEAQLAIDMRDYL